MFDLSSRVQPLIAPISAAAPTGENAKYSQDFVKLCDEMDKRESASAESVDWDLICKLGEAILCHQSKDLKIAAYYSYAMLVRDGFAGLSVGLQAITYYLQNYWDSFYPPPRRVTGRLNFLSWLTEQCAEWMGQNPPQPKDAAAVAEVAQVFEAYEEACRDRFEERLPALRPLRDEITRAQMSVPSAAPSPAPSETKTAPPAPPSEAANPAPPPQAAPPPASDAAPPEVISETSSDPDPNPPGSAQAPAAEDSNKEDKPETSPHDAFLATVAEHCAPFLQDLSGDNPAGADCRYDDTAERMRTEAMRGESLSGGDTDWQLVQNLGANLLSKKTKDLLLAAKWGLARYRLSGLTGLAEGYFLLASLVENYWDTVYPLPRRKSLKARANAIRWLNDRVQIALEGYAPKAEERPALQAIMSQSDRLASLCGERFEDQSPGFRDLADTFKRIELSLPEPAPPKAPPPKAPTPTPAPQKASAPTPAAPSETEAPNQASNLASNQAAAPSPKKVVLDTPEVGKAPSSAGEVTPFLRESGQRLAQVASMLRKVKRNDPTAYRLHRQGLWLAITNPPPETSPGKTGIPPLPKAQRSQYQTLAQNEKWAALLDECESNLGRHRYCLDLQHLVVQALQGLGDSEAAIQAIYGEVRALLTRLPELMTLCASDGSPLCAPSTTQWIQKEVLPQGGSADAGDEGTGLDLDRWWPPIERASQAKDHTALSQALQEALDQAGDRASYCRRALHAAESLSAPAGLSLLLYSLVHAELATRSGDQWQRGLHRRCLRGLLQARSKAARQKIPALSDPHTAALALELARTEIASALPYFSA